MYFIGFLFSDPCAGSSLLPGFSLVAASKGYSLVALCRLLIAVAFPAAEYGLYGTWWPLKSLWHTVSVALWHGIFLDKD